jgi:SAM-dependent methyltransferase
VSTHALQRNIRTSYDAVADDYALRVDGELDHKPFDRELLAAFALRVKDRGTVADLGCGPGMVSQYLHEHGVTALGIDLSPRMIARAHELHPGITFQCADFTHLEVPDGTYAGIVALYSLIHLPRTELQTVLREFFRVLAPGGVALIAFHIGSETRHASDWWDHAVELDFVFFEMAEMLSSIWGAGFDTELNVEREPYPEIEVQTQRGYIFAQKPDGRVVAET